MLVRRKQPWDDVPGSEITPYGVYLSRRRFIGAAAGATLSSLVWPHGALGDPIRWVPSSQQDELTPYEDITRYNNFYEFGTDKRDPFKNSGDFRPRPWSVEVTGHCAKPGTYGIEDLIRAAEVEERTYRLRCVEAWSMVIPWMGVPLATMLRSFEPAARAKFVAFETVFRPTEMPGQRRAILDWPYVEGLRMDEAMNELSLMATGIYGKDLLNQNGAPLRLVVPWKYGFKSIKSIVRISFVERMPPTTWSRMAPNEYGFFANVNPEVDHPRWSQARERRIGELRRRPTLMFNGYGDQVAEMYRGMDLTKLY